MAQLCQRRGSRDVRKGKNGKENKLVGGKEEMRIEKQATKENKREKKVKVQEKISKGSKNIREKQSR